jgi:hypothetical protein
VYSLLAAVFLGVLTGAALGIIKKLRITIKNRMLRLGNNLVRDDLTSIF